MSVKRVILHVELKPGEAAGLKRLADKAGWSEAMAVLYPHIDQEIRGDQTREILRALARIHEALEAMHVSSFPLDHLRARGIRAGSRVNGIRNDPSATSRTSNQFSNSGLRRSSAPDEHGST